ncbi:diacylglycerol/lipid kinase family protein [Vineibacter terrae]|uniref:diacylglycerol/lipid kinase family protein n=1 Tax=Vineibacter terrae TaxID=2586908 RepID=UPI002E36D615|nr:diacylglycerol kinase family protein [Vineibacter terrae]HEX2886301.1 diacylglycerol kinase family protein [Vineibacter terrae]
MRILAIINPGAGTAATSADLKRQLEALFAAHDIETELRLVAGPALPQAAQEARDRAGRGEIDAVVAGGGDGSLSAVASALTGTDVPMGVLALGTRNHFAKDLGLPLGLEAAVAVIARAQATAIDVAEVNGRVFINNSSIGAYPFMVLDRDRRRSMHGLAKWSAMALAAIRTLWKFPRRRLAIVVEGRSMPHKTPCVFIGNNEYSLSLPDLGGRARLDCGELWLSVVRPRNRLALLWLGLCAVIGRTDLTDDLTTQCATEVEIRSRASRLPVALDGEVEIMRPPLRYRSRPKALRVFLDRGRHDVSPEQAHDEAAGS